MKKSESVKQLSVLLFSIVFICGALFTTFAQADIKTVSEKKQIPLEQILANLNLGLESDNHGLRMSTVSNIGRYKISNFEDDLIEMFEDAEEYKDKETIALSLFQIGSLKSISALKKTAKNTENEKVKHLCLELLDRHQEYEKIRTEYFNNFVISMVEAE